MGLKNRLLVLGMAASAFVGGMTEAASADMPAKQPDAVSQNSASGYMTESQYQAHVKKIHDNISGKWGSFGDESLLEEAFLQIAATPQGQNVLSSVPEDIVIKSRGVDQDAYYVSSDKRIMIKSDIIGSAEDKKQNTFTMLFHELRHAKQEVQGVNLDGKGASVFQMTVVEKVKEAETRAWDFVTLLTYELDKAGLDKSILKDKKVVDLIAANLKANPNDEHKEMKIYTLKTLHEKCLRKNDFSKAQQETVKQLIPEYMQGKLSQKDPKWYDTYDVQAVNNTLINCRNGSVSQKGNAQAYQEVLDYYKNEYGLKPSDIEKTKLSGRAGILMQNAERVIKNVPTAEQKNHFETLSDEAKKLSSGEAKNALPNTLLPGLKKGR